MDMGRYTASFTTPLGMFDTKVHFDFTGSGKFLIKNPLKAVNFETNNMIKLSTPFSSLLRN